MRDRLILAAAIVLAATHSLAYEVHTHAEATRKAYERSRVAEMFITLGIFGESGTVILPKKYWDMSGGNQVARYVDDMNAADVKGFERYIVEETGVDADRPLGWLLRGVIREDDIGRVLNINGSLLHLKIDNPLDDPWNPQLSRPFHHFFDPATNRGLDAGIPSWLDPSIKKAPDWALGYVDSFATAPQVDAARRNHFSLADAKEAMWRALTGRRTGSTTPEFTPFDRVAYWSTVFRSLGTIQHNLQDMAQPQHTRNDSHAGVPALGDESEYEVRVNHRVRRTLLTRGKAGSTYILPPVNYGECEPDQGTGFCPLNFNGYKNYFSTSVQNVAAGKGLADYSNRGFFTVGTNLLNNSYLYPPNNVSSYTPVNTTGQDGRPVTLYLGTVPDLVFAPESNVKLTGESILDRYLGEAASTPTFSMYAEVFDEQARLLLPRAVAYSAGALNYFFRGKLALNLPPEKVYAVEDLKSHLQDDAVTPKGNAGFTKLKVNVRNATTPLIPPGGATEVQATDPAGTLVAVLRYRRNVCLKYPSLTGSPYLDSAGSTVWNETCRRPLVNGSVPDENTEIQPLPDVVVSEAVPAGDIEAGRDVVFTFVQALPFDAVDVDLQVIYRGQLGAEVDGMAIGFEHISEPTVFSFDNFSDCSRPGTCTPGTQDPTCFLTTSVKLPFHNSSVASPEVTSVTNLAPGQFARVVFLTRTGMQYGIAPDFIETVTNQVFNYDVHVYWVPEPVTWPGSSTAKIRAPLGISRPLALPDQPNLLGWEARGHYPSCPGGGLMCFNFRAAQSCPAIEPTGLRAAAILFP